MGFFDRLFNRDKGKSQPASYDSTRLGLEDLKRGFMLDYDLQTWQVTAVYYYDWGNNFVTTELQLESGSDLLYLHLEKDDELECSVARKVPLNEIDPRLRKQISEHDAPFDEITYQGRQYFLTEESLGMFWEEGKEGKSRLVSWDFEDRSEEYFINIERWGETDFEAAAGVYADLHEFSNILPAAES
jgi:hypothetical protein